MEFLSFSLFLLKKCGGGIYRNHQPPVITQEPSSHSARTSVASGGRLSILSEKLSRLSISSNHSARASVASDSVLIHKKVDGSRLSHSFEDSDTQAISAYYSHRKNSKGGRLSANDITIPTNHLTTSNSSKNIRFQLYPRSSDAIERSISSIDQSTGIIEEENFNSSRRPSARSESNPNPNSGRRQSLFRSPSSRHAIPKFPAVGRSSNSFLRSSISNTEQTLLLPPVSSGTSSNRQQEKTIRAALGAVIPDPYFIQTTCPNLQQLTDVEESQQNESTEPDEHLQKLRVRISFDEHRNDLLVNVVEGSFSQMNCSFFFLKHSVLTNFSTGSAT